MANYNPFFKKTGMQKITPSKPNKTVIEALTKLEKLGSDSTLMGSAVYNQKKLEKTGTQLIIDILTELSQRNSGIRRRLTNTANPYPKHQEFAQKIAAYSLAIIAEALKRLRFADQTKTYLLWPVKG